MSRPDQTQKALAVKRRKFPPELQRLAERAYQQWRKTLGSEGYELRDHNKQAWIAEFADDIQREIQARL